MDDDIEIDGKGSGIITVKPGHLVINFGSGDFSVVLGSLDEKILTL